MLAALSFGSLAQAAVGQCVTVHVGNSQKAQPRRADPSGRAWNKQTHKVDAMYECPHVHKQGSKTFRIRQLGPADSRDTTVVLRREGVRGHATTSWNDDVKFECCAKTNPHQQITIGSRFNGVGYGNTMDKEGWTTPITLKQGMVCPKEVSKKNWDSTAAKVNHQSHDRQGEQFETRTVNGKVSVRKVDGKGHWNAGSKLWNVNLVFNCHPHANTVLTPTQYHTTDKCYPSKCAEWSCRNWCECWEQEVEDLDLYSSACHDDGEVCDCDNLSQPPKVITVSGACGSAAAGNGDYTQVDADKIKGGRYWAKNDKSQWKNKAGYRIQFEAGNDWGAKALIKGEGWTIVGGNHHRYWVSADGKESIMPPNGVELNTRWASNCKPTLSY